MISITIVPARLSFTRICGSATAMLALCLLPLGAQEAPASAPQAETQSAAKDGEAINKELLSNSPFMSKAFKERLAKTDSSRARDLIFSGFAGDGDDWLICVYNNRSKRAEWVQVGAEVNGITIAEFDRKGLRIRVIKDASSTYLSLEEPK